MNSGSFFRYLPYPHGRCFCSRVSMDPRRCSRRGVSVAGTWGRSIMESRPCPRRRPCRCSRSVVSEFHLLFVVVLVPGYQWLWVLGVFHYRLSPCRLACRLVVPEYHWLGFYVSFHCLHPSLFSSSSSFLVISGCMGFGLVPSPSLSPRRPRRCSRRVVSVGGILGRRVIPSSPCYSSSYSSFLRIRAR